MPRFAQVPNTHFFGSIGLVLGFLGSLGMAWLGVDKYVLGEDVGGRPLFLVSILLLVFSMQFITTGIVTEMLTRIFYQDRPRVAWVDEATAQVTAGWMMPIAVAEAAVHDGTPMAGEPQPPTGDAESSGEPVTA